MRVLLPALVFFCFIRADAQYYYKDILGTRESADLVKTYQVNKVSRVVLTSFDGNNQKSADFYVEQVFTPATQVLKTTTRSDMGSESILLSYIDGNGRIIKTVDSNNILTSYTEYAYNDAGQLLSVSSSSVDSAKHSNEKEQHLWQWENSKPVRMLRIKNRIDTTYVSFKLDEDGNISEEQETRRGVRSEPVYYYYNENNQLTDIVRFNKKAKRLLPEYMFEYSEDNRVIQKITVPANSFDYLIWRYQYNQQGLKTKEAIYSKDDKRKQLGRIEYQYFFGT